MSSAIFIDLDGTLMKKGFTVSEANQQLLRQAAEKGYRIVLISGRPYRFVRYLANKIHPKIEAIGFNGACGDRIETQLLKPEVYQEVIENLYETTLNLTVKTMDHVYFHQNAVKSFVYPVSDHKRVDFLEFVDFQSLHKIRNVIKVMGMYDLKSDEDKGMVFFSERKLEYVRYPGKGFELVSQRANKGIAAKEHCQALNIPIESAYFMGDSYNDLSMFQLGGQSIAMGNAVDELKRMANYICEDYEDDAVAKSVGRILDGEW